MICGQLESDHRLSKYSLRDEKVKKTILKATGISKSFSHVPILKNVDFELDSAETHILMRKWSWKVDFNEDYNGCLPTG